MQRTALLLAALAPLLLAASCGVFPDDCRPDARIDVATSDRVLRGTWEGVVADHPADGAETDLVLDLEATWVDSNRYAVSGTFALDGHPPLDVEGEVFGGCEETYVRGARLGADAALLGPAMAPPPPARLDAEARDAAGTAAWSISSRWTRHDDRTSIGEGRIEVNLWHADAEDPPYHDHDVVLRRVR